MPDPVPAPEPEPVPVFMIAALAILLTGCASTRQPNEEDQRFEVVVSTSGAVNTQRVDWIPYRVFVQNTEKEVITLEGITLRAIAADMSFRSAIWSGRKVLEPGTGDTFTINAEVERVALAVDPMGPFQVTVTLSFVMEGVRQTVTLQRDVER